MSDNRIVEDDSHVDESKINIEVSSDAAQNETNGHFDFEEETLQITDVHAFEYTASELPVNASVELSSTNRHWETSGSPTSIDRFLGGSSGGETTHGLTDFQSELAALGLKSLYSPRQDENSSFEESFEKRAFSINVNNPSVKTVETTQQPWNSNGSIESNINLMEELSHEGFKLRSNKLDCTPSNKDKDIIKDLSLEMENYVETNSLENLSLIEIKPDTPKISDDSHNLQNSCDLDNLGKERSFVKPSTSFSEKIVEGLEKIGMSPMKVNEEKLNDSVKKNQNHTEEESELVEDNFGVVMPAHDQNNSNYSSAQSEDNDDEFVDAVDSEVLKDMESISAVNKFTVNVALPSDDGQEIVEKLISQSKEVNDEWTKRLEPANGTCNIKNDNQINPGDSSQSSSIDNFHDLVNFKSEVEFSSNEGVLCQENETSLERKSNDCFQFTDGNTEDSDNIVCKDIEGNVICNETSSNLVNQIDLSHKSFSGIADELEILLNVESSSEIPIKHSSPNKIHPSDHLNGDILTGEYQTKPFHTENNLEKSLQNATLDETLHKTQVETSSSDSIIEGIHQSVLLSCEEYVSDINDPKVVGSKKYDEETHIPLKKDDGVDTQEMEPHICNEVDDKSSTKIQEMETFRLNETQVKTSNSDISSNKDLGHSINISNTEDISDPQEIKPFVCIEAGEENHKVEGIMIKNEFNGTHTIDPSGMGEGDIKKDQFEDAFGEIKLPITEEVFNKTSHQETASNEDCAKVPKQMELCRLEEMKQINSAFSINEEQEFKEINQVKSSTFEGTKEHCHFNSSLCAEHAKTSTLSQLCLGDNENEINITSQSGLLLEETNEELCVSESLENETVKLLNHSTSHTTDPPTEEAFNKTSHQETSTNEEYAEEPKQIELCRLEKIEQINNAFSTDEEQEFKEINQVKSSTFEGTKEHCHFNSSCAEHAETSILNQLALVDGEHEINITIQSVLLLEETNKELCVSESLENETVKLLNLSKSHKAEEETSEMEIPIFAERTCEDEQSQKTNNENPSIDSTNCVKDKVDCEQIQQAEALKSEELMDTTLMLLFNRQMYDEQIFISDTVGKKENKTLCEDDKEKTEINSSLEKVFENLDQFNGAPQIYSSKDGSSSGKTCDVENLLAEEGLVEKSMMNLSTNEKITGEPLKIETNGAENIRKTPKVEISSLPVVIEAINDTKETVEIVENVKSFLPETVVSETFNIVSKHGFDVQDSVEVNYETPNKIKSYEGKDISIKKNHESWDSSYCSFYSQHPQDMSLTVMGECVNNIDTSQFELSRENGKENCLPPTDQLSQTLTDIADNVDIVNTNDFTSQSDQKMYDALYVPLSESNENNYSVTDCGLQSFMEITMANTSVAIIKRSSNNKTKSFASDECEDTKESPEVFYNSESSHLSVEYEDRNTCDDSPSSSSFSMEHIDNKNHEMMQQSMSDYVINQILNLAIPDSDHLSIVNNGDEETRKKCEEQTENVLLMKWPAQYHDDLKALKQQNQLLSESSNQKDKCIDELKKDKEGILQTLSKVTARSEEISKENEMLKNSLNNLRKNNDLIQVFEEENKNLKKDLETLRSIEQEFFNLKLKNEELVHTIEKNRLDKEGEISVLKGKIEELENELLTVGQTVIDFQSQSEELSKLVESIQNKENQIEKLINDKTMLEEKVLKLDSHIETLDLIKLENNNLREVLEIEREKNKESEKFKIMLEQQNDEFFAQNEKLAKLVTDLNVKDEQIQDLFEKKLFLEETVASLNTQLEELRKIETIYCQLKYDLQEEINKKEEYQALSKSLEERSILQVESISKLNMELSEKDSQIETLLNNKSDLTEIIETLNRRLEELKEFEGENEQLKLTLKVEDEKIKEYATSTSSLQEQVDNLKAQNELLWNELKVSSTKEQSLYALKEERLLLEEKLVQMKKEIKEISSLKSDNELLIDELTKKNSEICNLKADKKKLKSSLIKANDSLNERDAEIERLSESLQDIDTHLKGLIEEKANLESDLEEMTTKYDELKEELSNERLILAEDVANASEYFSSIILENAYLVEEINTIRNEDCKLLEEIGLLKKKIVEEKVLSNDMQSEKESLTNNIISLKDMVHLLTEELNQYKYQCSELPLLKEENEALGLKIDDLKLIITEHEKEKSYVLEDMSSLSETISNLLFDQQALSEQLKLNSEMSECIVFLKADKCELEQQILLKEQSNSVLVQSNSALQNELEKVKNKDTIIKELEDFATDLEDHLTSMNEELISEISKNQYLTSAINELESKLIQNNEEISVLQHRISSLTEQLHSSTRESNGLEQLVSGLENHVSSLNEELMSEIAKNHFISIEYENLMTQHDTVIKEKQFLENMVSFAVEALKNRLNSSNNDKELSLQSYIDDIILEINHFKKENSKLANEIGLVQVTLHNSNQSVSDLLKDKQSLELELSATTQQNMQLQNELTKALAKESHIEILEKENESLLHIAEIHKSCEEEKSELQNKNSKLERQIQSLSESIEAIHSEQQQFDYKIKEHLQLKEIMTKEIHSLTGEIYDSGVEPLINVYQKLMGEFLNKEKEVIVSLQSDCERKIIITQNEIGSLKNELNEREELTSKLGKEIEEYKIQLNHRDSHISDLENELVSIKNDLNGRKSEIEEFKSMTEKEKEILISELNIALDVGTKLEEKISVLTHEINCKDNEIVLMKSDLEKMDYEKTNLLRRTDENSEVSKHNQELIDELRTKLNDCQELISQLNLQLQNKNNEVNQLTEYLEGKEIEAKQYVKKIEEFAPALSKLNSIENEVNLIDKILMSMDEDFDVESLINSFQTCEFLGDVIRLIVSKFAKLLNQAQTSNNNLKIELAKQVELCKSLETQINDMNEELKSHKLLYDEDSLQFKEEIAAKNVAIANLTEALEALKSKAHVEAENRSTGNAEIKNLLEELQKLKEENKKLHDESMRIPYLTEVNRKLSWEIEELSRSIKFEKQSNIDLKTKCDLASNQVAELSKKNFQLEDKIDVLESKLKNFDVMSSLKISFPLGINTVDKQVQYVNEKLIEFDQINNKLSNLMEDYSSLKLEHEKSKEYIKKQEEKISKIMKRELELKKQIASNLQTPPDIKILKGLKTELSSLFPDQNLSLTEILSRIKSLVEGGNKVCDNNTEIEELRQKITELTQDNKDLDVECEMMNKHIKEQEELLASLSKREEELKKLNTDLKTQLSNQINSDSPSPAIRDGLNELFRIFPEQPTSIKDSISLIKHMIDENIALKEKVTESQEEYANLDKECEDMFKAYQIKEKELEDILKREEVLKNNERELENKLKALSVELETVQSQRTTQENLMNIPASCQCGELKSRLSELKGHLAERNAKITALELQFEADNFPLKKKVADLEKSLDQSKQKINELKSEVRRYHEQMSDVTVGLRAECERCRSLGTGVDPNALTSLQQQLQEKSKEINILKALCKTRNQKIKELEERDNSHKMPRTQRSALKEVKENKTVPSSPTKPGKGSFH